MKRRRTYASYWEFSDESARDKGIVARFVSSVGADVISIAPGTLHARGHDDPPDCEALATDGARVAFELSEIVDADAVRMHTQRRGLHFREFTQSEFRTLLNARLEAKVREEGELKGGPYARRILLLHTDEGMLYPAFCEEALELRPLLHFAPWTDVFLIFPPPPHFDGTTTSHPRLCPVIRIQ